MPRRSARALGSRSGWLLAVCCLAQFMVILDLSIVNVALPSIQSSLGFTPPDLQWVVDAYAITFAGFLMFGGRAADHFGQRRTFVVALLLFGAASLAGGAASSRLALILARGVQGFGGALMAACSLAIITSSFEEGPRRNRAIGLWATMNGAGGAAGVLFGGIITEALTWRWVLLINPPIALAAALVAYRVTADRRRAHGPGFDVAGAVTLTAGQMVLVYGVVKAGLEGWQAAAALGPILGGIALLVVFGVIEARFADAPLVPFRQLTKRLQVANNIVLLFSAALFPMWVISSLYLQQVLGQSPLDAGLLFLPMTLMIAVFAPLAGRLSSRLGVRPVLLTGLTMLTAGLLGLSRIGSSGSPVLYVMLPGLLAAAGIAMSIVPSTIAATLGAREGQAGLASGLVNTSRQIGGGLGLAVLVTLATQHSTDLIGTGRSVPDALTEGFRLAYYIAAGLAAAAAVLAFVAIPRVTADGASPSRRRRIAAVAVVLVAGLVALELAIPGSHGAPIGRYVTAGTDTFVSEPGLHPPRLRAHGRTRSDRLSPGVILLANFYDLSRPPMVGQSGPLIVDNRLSPVWFKPVPKDVLAANLSLQTLGGRPVLAWWQGVLTSTGQTLSGEDVVVDQHYRTIATLKGARGWTVTLHGLQISGDDIWVTANRNIPVDLSRYGGAYNGVLIDVAVQEYNLRTGQLLRSWDAFDHVSPRDSYASLPTNGFPWDAYHVNSIDVTGPSTFLVSIRNTWAAYMVNANSGRIGWTLGGKHSTFRFGDGAAFQWQHDVELQGASRVTMYDDHCCQLTSGGTFVPPTDPSRGLVLNLDQRSRRASLVDEYPHADGLNAAYLGSAQLLARGNVLVGWGAAYHAFTEYSHSGDALLDVTLPRPDQSYRAKLAQWAGLPLGPPAAAARDVHGRTTAYASWNGATGVAAWRILGGPSAARLAAVATAPRSGFETAVALAGRYATFEAQALDARGRVMGTSRPFAPARA